MLGGRCGVVRPPERVREAAGQKTLEVLVRSCLGARDGVDKGACVGAQKLAVQSRAAQLVNSSSPLGHGAQLEKLAGLALWEKYSLFFTLFHYKVTIII